MRRFWILLVCLAAINAQAKEENTDILDRSDVFEDLFEDAEPDWRPVFSLGVGGGSNSFHASGQARYIKDSTSFEPLWELAYRERSEDDFHSKLVHGKAQLRYVLFRNSIVEPYAGGGVGIAYWNQSHRSEEYDNRVTPTAPLDFGLRINFTRRIGLVVNRNITYYRPRAPYRDATDSEDRASTEATSIQFTISLG